MKIILLDVYYIMVVSTNHYKLTAVDLSREKELDADLKAIKICFCFKSASILHLSF